MICTRLRRPAIAVAVYITNGNAQQIHNSLITILDATDLQANAVH
jgi:hypothetical protein